MLDHVDLQAIAACRHSLASHVLPSGRTRFAAALARAIACGDSDVAEARAMGLVDAAVFDPGLPLIVCRMASPGGRACGDGFLLGSHPTSGAARRRAERHLPAGRDGSRVRLALALRGDAEAVFRCWLDAGGELVLETAEEFEARVATGNRR